MPYTHIFFAIDGVLGSGGWDRAARSRAGETLGLGAALEAAHADAAGDWEAGRIELDEYLDLLAAATGADRARLAALVDDPGRADEATLALARRLATAGPGAPLVMALDNLPAELAVRRIEAFGLRGLFAGFLLSCWLGARKPSREFHARALGVAGAAPEEALVIDHRADHLAAATAIGMDTIRFTDAAALQRTLEGLGLLEAALAPSPALGRAAGGRA
jgi:putative hydrolase of the HAD superfamily